MGGLPIQVALAATAVINILLALVVIAKNQKKQTHRFFAAFIGFVFVWTIGTYLLLFLKSDDLIPVAAFLFYPGAIFIAYYVLLFSIAFPDERRVSRTQKGLFAIPPALLFLSFSIDPDLILKEVVINQEGINTVIPNEAWFIPYMLYFNTYFFITYIWIFKKYSQLKGTYRTQLYYSIFGIIFSSIPAMTTNLTLPLFGVYEFIWLGPLFTLMFAVTITLAIVRHKVFDIRLIVARSVTYLLLLATLSLTYIATIFGASSLFFEDNILSGGQQFIYIVMALFIALTFQPLKRFFDRLTNNIFYRDAYDTQEVLNDISDMIVQEVEMSALSQRVLEELESTLKSEHAHLLVITSGAERLKIYDVGRRLSDEEALHVEDISAYTEGVYVTDEMEEGRSKELLNQLNIAVFVRLMTKSETVGFLALGPKLSGNIYNSKDVKLLQIMSNDLAVALQNARRFEEIEAFNITLKQEVDDATRELRKSNEKLKALDEAKDEFISMASHQLRTPLTSIKGYVSMVMEGDAGKISAKQKELLGSAFTSSQRMVFLISDMLNVSRLKTGKFIIEPKVVDLTKLVESEVKQLVDTAKGRKLTLTFSKPKTTLPKVKLDESKTRQVVMNFIDNAIYYTRAGGRITVELKQSGQSVELTVTDTGIGIPKSSQHKLFTKFYRAENARKARPDGTGLGLFMAKKVIVAQRGAIIFHSEEGKGSTFGFRFPLAKVKADVSEDPSNKGANQPEQNQDNDERDDAH